MTRVRIVRTDYRLGGSRRLLLLIPKLSLPKTCPFKKENEKSREATELAYRITINLLRTNIWPESSYYDWQTNQSSTYNELEQVTSTVSDHDCLIVMGDFNSRLAHSDGKTNYMGKELIGRWSIHPNDDQGGDLLRCIMRRQGLCAISTMFQPQKNHTNTTWIKANMKPSQIDHILVGTRWSHHR